MTYSKLIDPQINLADFFQKMSEYHKNNKVDPPIRSNENQGMSNQQLTRIEMDNMQEDKTRYHKNICRK